MAKELDDDEVERRLKELEAEIDLESKAAQKALDKPEVEGEDAEDSEEVLEEGDEASPPKRRRKKKKKRVRKVVVEEDFEDEDPEGDEESEDFLENAKETVQDTVSKVGKSVQAGAAEFYAETLKESMKSGESMGSSALTLVGRNLPTKGPSTVKQKALVVAGVGVGGYLAVKLLLPMLLAPIWFGLGLAIAGLKLALVAGLGYGGFRLYQALSEDDPEE